MKKILITGGSGYLGRNITKFLLHNGFEVSWLSRSPVKNAPVPVYLWDYTHQIIDTDALNHVEIIIHLAGANISKRWTEDYKKELYESRIDATRFLVDTINKIGHQTHFFIQASAVGYYGLDRNAPTALVGDPPGDDFLAQLYAEWESSSIDLAEHIHLSIMRLGIVISPGSKAFQQMTLTMPFGISPIPGDGNQYLSYVYLETIYAHLMFFIEKKIEHGIYNLVESPPLTYRQVIEFLSQNYHLPQFKIPIPKFLLKIILGEMAEIICEGRAVNK